MDTSSSPEVHSLLRSPLGSVRPVGLDKCVMTHTRHCNIVQRTHFTAPVICPLTSPPAPPRATTGILTVSVHLPFPGRHVGGLTQCIGFSNWLLSLNNTQGRLLHVRPGLDGSSAFRAEQYSTVQRPHSCERVALLRAIWVTSKSGKL